MRLSKFILLATLFLFLFSCGTNYTPTYKNATVSWYGKPFHGRTTANGEKYNMHKLTAAHKKLPFGTRVLLINPENNKKVIVRINDRGPFVAGREFDLSKKAFSKLAPNQRGILKVKYKILK